MRSLVEMEINRYMRLSYSIADLENKKIMKRRGFYNQTFSTGVVYRDYQVYAKGIRFDKAVCELIGVLETIDKRIEIAKVKQKYWLEFLNSLSLWDQDYFKQKYLDNQQSMNERLDNLAAAEIEEIQQAITFQVGYEDEDTLKLDLSPTDYTSNIDTVLKAIGGE